MEDNNSRDFHDAAEEAEEALSLCDLPLDAENNTSSNNNFEEIITNQNQSQSQIQSSSSSSSHDDQFFEFLSDLSSSEMCPAEDIIFCGKLMPSAPQPSSSSSSTKEDKAKGYAARSNSTKNCQFLRISRSLDYQKLRRSVSSKTTPDFDIQRSASVRSAGRADIKKSASSKPKWYLPMFGILKFPPEIDMRDIKSRQFRRSSSVMFPSFDAEGNFPDNRSTGKSSPSSYWRFIKALSCSDHASVAVTASLCVSHA